MNRRHVFTLTAGVVFAAHARADASAPFMMNDPIKPMPELQFNDADGKSLSVADFKGKTVLLNIWATWCGPCRKEMPTLDRLQATLGGPDFMVLPVSIDRQGMDAVSLFYADTGIKNLGRYIAPAANHALDALSVWGLPATLLLDRQGRELGRRSGSAEWDTPEMIDFFKTIINQQKETIP
ncbi:MAG: TlpA family protein disulfide reductase [Alphaproteobacteria bacterium]|nr:TlpA family protein disulfide reductase [Alphaproteobacteria bacterium]